MKNWILAAAVLGLGASGARAEDRLAPGAHDAPVGAVTLHYVVSGDGAPVLVFSPGWGPGSLYLQRGLAPLAAHRRLVFVDSRGSGGSTRPADETRMALDDMADDVEAMRVYLGLAKVDLLGHSAAGGAAIEYAERYPARVGRMVLVDAAAVGTSADDKAEDAALEADIGKLSHDPRYASAVQHMMHDPYPPADDAAMMRQLKAAGALDFADPEKAGPVFQQQISGMRPSAYAMRTTMAADRARPVEQESKLGRLRQRC